MRIPPTRIDTEFYNDLSSDKNAWALYYERPPKIAQS